MKDYLLTPIIFILLTGNICKAQELPHTLIGRLTEQMIQAINSGNQEQQTAFISANFAKGALKRGTAFLQKGFTYLNAQAGGLTLAEVLLFPDTNRLDVILHSRIGDHWLSLQMGLSSSDPGKIEGYGLGLGEDPAVTRAFTWPKSTNNEAANLKEIDRQAGHATATGLFSGVVLVAKNQHILFCKAYGLADQTFNVPNDTATRFNIGSINKMFTAVAIGQLVQAEKLSFEDTLAKVLPDYPDKAIAKKVTIAQLLSHTSGMGDYLIDEFYAHKGKYLSLAAYLPLFQKDTLAFEPGARWSYSNAAYIVLGLVIERLSGEDYFTYIRKHIYEPAGMQHTDSYNRDAVIPNLAVGYMRPEGFDPLRIQPRQMNWEYLWLKGSSAGGGYSTAGDLLRFTVALQNHVLLNSAITETLLNGKVNARGRGPGVQYGYGFFDTLMGNTHIAGHGGGAEGINADVKMFRDGTYTLVLLSNYDTPAAAGLSQQIATFLSNR